MNRTKREIENLLMPPAGLSAHHDTRGSAAECMIFEERPSTPEDVRKFRRSANLEPGKRFQNPKTVEDLKTLQLESKTFGVSSKTSETSAAALFKQTPPNGLVGKLNFMKAENIYFTTRREPLGKVYSRHHQLPQKFVDGEQAFGETSKGQNDTAKNLLFPRITEGTNFADDMYKKSHGTWGVGEQKTRGYNWNYDPNKTVFGMKGKDIAFNGVSKNVAEVLTASKEESGPLVSSLNVENFKDLGDTLGKPRNLGIGASSIPPETVFGKPSIPSNLKDVWGAAETIRGEYGDSRDDGTTVDDLGRSITPGFRNITTEDRAYGVPSIRVDLPRIPVNKRSMADPMNYGDDVSARELISPQDFSNLSITPQDFHKPLSHDRIKHIFTSIGYHLADDISEFIYDLASQGQGGCSIHQYRVVMNDYLYAEETGNPNDWLRANGFTRRK